MSFHVVWPDESLHKQRGFGRVAHVPFVFSSQWEYNRAVSNYLIERALLDWRPRRNGGRGTARFLTKASLRAFSEALCNFLEWAERRGLDWRQVEYAVHLIEGYQAQMLRGSWSVSAKPLAAATVNLRVQEVCNFLTWAAERGLRPPFAMLTELRYVRADIATSSHGHRSIAAESRIGRVRLPPARLRLPTDEEVHRWLAGVRIERGATKALMSELVLQTAVRREEAAAWRVDTLATQRADWDVFGSDVLLNIKYGTKGQSYGEDHGDKIGPERRIALPLAFAQRLTEYRELKRPQARATWVRGAATLQEKRSRMARPSPHLFLSEHTGERITAKTLYEAWTGTSRLPYAGWSPHLGRHYWACKTLLLAAMTRAEQMTMHSKTMPVDWVSGNGCTDIMLLIKPQLGHVDQKTTEMYLTWLVRAFGHDTHERYAQHLDLIGVRGDGPASA